MSHHVGESISIQSCRWSFCCTVGGVSLCCTGNMKICSWLNACYILYVTCDAKVLLSDSNQTFAQTSVRWSPHHSPHIRNFIHTLPYITDSDTDPSPTSYSNLPQSVWLCCCWLLHESRLLVAACDRSEQRWIPACSCVHTMSSTLAPFWLEPLCICEERALTLTSGNVHWRHLFVSVSIELAAFKTIRTWSFFLLTIQRAQTGGVCVARDVISDSFKR